MTLILTLTLTVTLILTITLTRAPALALTLTLAKGEWPKLLTLMRNAAKTLQQSQARAAP